MKESHLRSVLKAITYRIVGTLTSGAIVYLLTGDLHLSLAVIAIEPIVKTVVYYLHERAWQRVPRGYVRKLFRLRSS